MTIYALARTNVLNCGRAAFLAANKQRQRDREERGKVHKTAPPCLSALAPSAAPACISILLSGARLNNIACNTHCADSWHVEKREVRERMCVCVCACHQEEGRPSRPTLAALLGAPKVGCFVRLGWLPSQGPRLPCHAMPCHVRPGPTPPRRDAAGCRASEPTGAWTGGQRSNSAIIHLMLSHSQSRRPDETRSLIPAHSSSNIRDIHEPVSQSASHPRSIPFPILPTFWPRQVASPSQSSQSGQYVDYQRIHAPAHHPLPSKRSPPSNRRASSPHPPCSQSPSFPPPTPQPQALLRSILEHFLPGNQTQKLCVSIVCVAQRILPFLYSTTTVFYTCITLGASLPPSCHPYRP